MNILLADEIQQHLGNFNIIFLTHDVEVLQHNEKKRPFNIFKLFFLKSYFFLLSFFFISVQILKLSERYSL